MSFEPREYLHHILTEVQFLETRVQVVKELLHVLEIPPRASPSVPQAQRFAEPFQTQENLGDRQLARARIVFAGLAFVQRRSSQPPLADAPTLLIHDSRTARGPRRLHGSPRLLARVTLDQRSDGGEHIPVDQLRSAVKDGNDGRFDVLENVCVPLFNPHRHSILTRV